jgi:anti-anti-sigma regulatory factor
MTPQPPTDELIITQDGSADSFCRLRLVGHLDQSATIGLHESVKGRVAASPRLLALDLTDLATVTLCGVRVLATIAKWAAQANIALCLIAPLNHPVRDVLLAAHLAELFELHPNLSTALIDAPLCAGTGNVMERDHKARELSAWGDHLREQRQRLAEEVACVLGRLADTEEHVAETFARRALAAPHRADQLCRWASLARTNIHRLRNMQAQLRQATLPNHLHDEL